MSNAADNFVLSNEAITVAIIATVISVCISGFSIYQHLVHYTCPNQQRYIIRLLFTCPLYAITSLLSLRFAENAVYFETLRDCYESLVVYTFMVLILEYAGGEGNCVTKMQGRAPLRPPFPCCMMEPRPRTVDLLRECKRGTLQFVVIKPVVGILSIIMVSQDLYYNPIYQTLMLTVYNISYTVALYYLLVFYLATKEACANYYPVSKFAAVKTVVFATYYQGMLIRCMGMPNELSEGWSDFILCIEMILFALMLSCAFTKEPYDLGVENTDSVGRARTVMQSASNVLAVRDMVQDAYHNFMPAYQDYLLQREDTATMAKVRRRIKFPGSKTASTPDNQLLLTGLCWGVDTCMSLEVRGQEVVGEGLNKNGFFSVNGKLSNDTGEETKEAQSSTQTPKQKLELVVTNDHNVVTLSLTSHVRKAALRLPLNKMMKKKKPPQNDEESQSCTQPQTQLPASWRGKTEDGGDAVFDSMTESEARKFTTAMSDTDSRNNQIQEEEDIELGSNDEIDTSIDLPDSYDKTAMAKRQGELASPPLILPPPVKRNVEEDDVAFSPFHSTLPPPTIAVVTSASTNQSRGNSASSPSGGGGADDNKA